MKNEELVRLTTQDVSEGIPVTNSIIIADKINYPHHQLMRLIKKHIDDFKEFGAIRFENELLNSKGVDFILLNESQFLLLVTYLRATKEKSLVNDLKKEMVRQFTFMKKELQARVETRSISKVKRKSLTDAIKKHVVNEGNFKSFAYSTYSKLVYKKVIGMTVKKFKDKNNLKESDNVRDFLTNEQLEKVQELESKIATYIQMRTDLTKDDKLVYEEVKKVIDGEVEV